VKSYDNKKLWARSGNVCSFPGCKIELVPEQQTDRVIGEEAHIKGEKPTAARYDPEQTPECREGYGNRILLCPTHHTLIDADVQTWTVERLLEIKTKHELQVKESRRYPELLSKLSRLTKEFESYEPPEDLLDPVVPEIMQHAETARIVRVDASREGGINTLLHVVPGQTIVLFARGLISYDNGRGFAAPEGILCNEYGLPLLAENSKGKIAPVIWPHERAYRTDGDILGRIGSLFGWIDMYTPQGAFLIGSKREIEVTGEGDLYLSVNDAVGTYGDNDGEFRVDIRVLSSGGPP